MGNGEHEWITSEDEWEMRLPFVFTHFPFMFTRVPFMFTRVTFVFTRVTFVFDSCSLVLHSCSIRVHWCSIRVPHFPFVFTRVPSMFPSVWCFKYDPPDHCQYFNIKMHYYLPLAFPLLPFLSHFHAITLSSFPLL